MQEMSRRNEAPVPRVGCCHSSCFRIAPFAAHRLLASAQLTQWPTSFSIDQLKLEGKRALIRYSDVLSISSGSTGILNGDRELMIRNSHFRVDFNVPFDEGKISNTQRIEAALPTIKHALDKGASVIR